MNMKYRGVLEALAAAKHCSLREAALQVSYEHYTGRGYSLDQVKEFMDWLPDDKLFWVFDHIQEYEAAPKYEHKQPFWFF